MDLLEPATSFIHFWELGELVFRCTDLLTLVGNQSVPYCFSIVWTLSLFQSPFREVSLYLPWSKCF